MKKNEIMNENVTRVVCQNCGAEMTIKQQSSVVVGKSIGKDSGLGTVVLPTNPTNDDFQSALNQLIASAQKSGNADLVESLQRITQQIEDDGYLEVQNIVRRWLPSQCLQMLNSYWGFHKSLETRGYRYAWEVLIAELERQAKFIKDGDIEEFKTRNIWYNQEVALEMAKSFRNMVLNHLKKLPVKKCNGVEYKAMPYYKNYKGIFLSAIPEFVNTVNELVTRISTAQTPAILSRCVSLFYHTIVCGTTWKPTELPEAFTNAYKAAGAYYTMKDLILFEGCRLPQHTDQLHWGAELCDLEGSLETLEWLANQYKSGKMDVMFDGYKMLGILKYFLKINKFDYEATKNKWYEASVKRREARKRAARRAR